MIRRTAYYVALRLRGSRMAEHFEAWKRTDLSGGERERTEAALEKLLRHCEDRVPWYSPLVRSARRHGAARPSEVLSRLPVLTKAQIRAHQNQLCASDLSRRRWFMNTSGGSTGEPVCLIQDAEYADLSGAVAMIFLWRAGCAPGDLHVKLWGSERDILCEQADMRSAVSAWLRGTTMINAFRMTPRVMEEALHKLSTRPPRLMIAYAQAAWELARFAQARGIKVAPQNGVMTSAGTLYPFMRKLIEDVFGCPVYNRYGSREAGDIASECSRHGGLHVFPEGSFVEILDDNGRPVPAGTEGNIVVTCLTNFAMPLLRYAIGDRGSLAEMPCPCGRGGQLLQRVSGRNADVFRRADGTVIDGEYFTHLMYFRPWVKSFQVVQRSLEQIEFRIVPSEQRERCELDEIAANSRKLMGAACEVRFSFLPEIECSPSGKYRYTISEAAQ